MTLTGALAGPSTWSSAVIIGEVNMSKGGHTFAARTSSRRVDPRAGLRMLEASPAARARSVTWKLPRLRFSCSAVVPLPLDQAAERERQRNRLPSHRLMTGTGLGADCSAPSEPRGCPAVVPDRPGELGAAGDVQLAEDLAQVVLDGAGAEEQPGGDLPVGQVPGDQPGDLLLLGGEHPCRLGAARTRSLAGGAELGPGPGGESFHADRVEQREGGAQLVAGVAAAPLAAQPLTVQQMGTPEFYADASAAKAVDRLAVEGLGVVTFGNQCLRAGLDAERPVSATSTGGC